LQAIEKEEVVENAPATLCKEDASSDESMRVKFEQAVRKAQDEICKAVSDMDGKEFHEDAWTRPGGGGGVSRVLQVVATCT
jgi:coproporphyrinogen III oxidase